MMIVLIILGSKIGHAQNFYQNQHWYFGNNCALDFSSGSPVNVNGSALATQEGCASISDSAGNLLLYTNGVSVWNRNNAQMPNGYGLFGNISTTQSALIVPKPGSTTIYYIFTADAFMGYHGICYSEVNMSINIGLGDVTIKNIQLLSQACEKLVAVRHCNGIDYWVITHGYNDDSYYCYLVSIAGIANPVVNNVGTYISGNDYVGYLKASPNTKKLANALFGSNKIELYDFDNSTGIISNPIDIIQFAGYYNYGLTFSSDSKKLYTSGDIFNDVIYQYDISSNNQATILASQYTVATFSVVAGALQLGPDNKIYISKDNTHYLDAIDSPNVIGAGCTFIHNAVSVGNNLCQGGLPNNIDAAYALLPFPPVINRDTTVCNDSAVLVANSGGLSYLWSTGDTVQTTTIYNSGDYWVQVQGIYGCDILQNFTDTFHVTLASPVLINMAPFNTICYGDSLTIDAGNPGSLYLWSNMETTETIIVSSSNSYSVTVTGSGGCTASAHAIVTVDSVVPHISGNLFACAGDSTLLFMANYVSYLWSTGTITQSIYVNVTGTYSITVTDSFGCAGTGTHSFTINPNPTPIITANGPTTFCQGDSVSLNAGNYSSYIWNTSSTSQSITVTATGLCTVTVTDGYGCTGTASENVSVIPTDSVRSYFIVDSTDGCKPLYVHFINASSYATSFHWIFSGGGTSDSTNPVHLISHTGYDTITLIAFDSTACGIFSDTSVLIFYFTVFNPPVQPVITQSNDTLHSSALSGNQWYRNSLLISGAINDYYVVTQNGSYSVKVINASGCTSSSTAHDITTGINEITVNSNRCFTFPNPTINSFTISCQLSILNSQFQIRDVTGRTLLSTTVSNAKEPYIVDVSFLSDGMYFYALTDDNETWTGKFIKE